MSRLLRSSLVGLCLALVPFLSVRIFAEEPPAEPAKEANPAAALDFWLGTWTVRWETAEGETQEGANTITRILDGKVIHESFDASAAMKYRGESVTVYDAKAGIWKQTWVDSQGAYLDFEGGPEDDRFILRRQFVRPDGVEVENRMVFHDLSPDAFVWDWEGRRVGTEDWTLLWRIHYTRQKETPAGAEAAAKSGSDEPEITPSSAH